MHLSRCCSAGWGVYSDTGKDSGGRGAWLNFFWRPELLFPAIHDHCAHGGEIIGKAGQKKWARDKGDAGYFGREGLTAVEADPCGGTLCGLTPGGTEAWGQPTHAAKEAAWMGHPVSWKPVHPKSVGAPASEGLTAVQVNPWVNDFEDFGSSAVIKLSRGIRGERPTVLRFEMTEDKLRFDLGGGKTEMKQVEVFASPALDAKNASRIVYPKSMIKRAEGNHAWATRRKTRLRSGPPAQVVSSPYTRDRTDITGPQVQGPVAPSSGLEEVTGIVATRLGIKEMLDILGAGG